MARINRFGRAAIVGGLLAVAGCQPSGQAPGPPGRVIQRLGAAAASAAAYMASAASIDLFEIQPSQLALTRSRNARHRSFAAMMIRAHQGTSAQLSFLLPRHRALLDALAGSGDFAAAYHRQQIAVHEEALRLHGDYARGGASPTLRPVAANALPIVRNHLEMMRAM